MQKSGYFFYEAMHAVLGPARAALTELINDFGRRRSPERAALHVELARVAQAEGKIDEALAEMEAASKMDVSNAAIQKELAEMARTAGQLLEGGAGALTSASPAMAAPAPAPSSPEQQTVQPTCRGPAYSFGRGIAIGALAALTGTRTPLCSAWV